MSKQIAGIFAAIGGLLLVQFGFSDSCSSEILSKGLPLLGALPGLALTYWARVSKGDIGFSGVRKTPYALD